MVPRLASSSRATVCRNGGQPRVSALRSTRRRISVAATVPITAASSDQAELDQQPERGEFAAERLQGVADGAGQLLDVVHSALPVEPTSSEALGICPRSGPISDRAGARHPPRQAVRGYAHVRPGFVRRTTDDAAELPRFRRRHGAALHQEELAERMVDGAGGPAAARASWKAPRRSASALWACRRNTAASNSKRAPKSGPSRWSPRKSRAAIQAWPTSWCRTGRSRCCCASSRPSICRRNGSSAWSPSRNS